ncbi:type II secretion system F family protein [Pseudomonas extremaustralis]|uniref:General secretion pathway protein F n=1 Tax=Pseudomonas extremaustralis TaxID=359110 RepID=A0A5C5QB84_9PSED|nr:type II secretion system F family protein [Pseudomonas extremaustralis]EZI27041.1 type II secretion system protein [Pseudomonas extremaustralis 14-3 substr. 14-3b]MDG2966703.1 type II secretion system F family protein [Pseudomonas extremaustralis]TWS01011.1 type II secretion system F family protein [Pseudomonas extremaustralis]UUJ38462.1 type II secretion system F family protein [Pseudomonas extremaustralis]SDG14528.1 general secretion pathway protein F [Pseudomonas extremaustralis]
MIDFDARIVRDGHLHTLRVQALDVDQARHQLQADGAQVISLQARRQLRWPGRRARFALGLFIQELVVLLDAGLVLVEAVETLRDKAAPGINRQVMSDLLASMYQGNSLSKALQLKPEVFPSLLIATVASSEHSGQLSVALRRYHHFEAHLEAVKKRVSGALMYPMVVLSVGALILVFLLFFVIPRFAAVFDAVADLPATARLMVWWGDLVQTQGNLLLTGLVLAVGGLVLLLRSAAFKQRAARLLWKIPSLGAQRTLFVLARFYRTAGMLLMGGMPVVTAVALSGALLPAERQADLRHAMTDIQAGQPLSTSLARHQLTTAVAERLLRVGEQSGELAAMCERIAQFHDEALERAIELFSKVFEPLLMLVVGGLIGLIVFMLYMPIFELAGSIQG